MDAKHTPGPWRIEGTRGPGFIISAGTNRYGDGPDSYVGVLGPMHAAPTRADALLACAAPDMLKALSEWVDYLDGPDEEGSFDDEERLMNAMRAAIAKARGQA